MSDGLEPVSGALNERDASQLPAGAGAAEDSPLRQEAFIPAGTQRLAAGELSEDLGFEVQAFLIDVQNPPSVAMDALTITSRCFPHEPWALGQMMHAYGHLLNRKPVILMENTQYTDAGKHLELLAYYTYYKEGVPAGVGGVYRYTEEPDKFWLGRFAVAPEFQGTGFAQTIIDHLCAQVARRGGEGFYAYTEEGPENAKAQRFYEKTGWTLTNETFVEQGVLQRVYRLDPSPRTPRLD